MSDGARIRRAERRERFVIIDRTAVDDARLSYRALGLLVYILSKPDNWKVHVNHLASQHAEGREAVRTALNELLTLGYAVRNRGQGEGGRFEWEFVIYELPQPTADADGTIAQVSVDGSTVDGASVDGPSVDGEPAPSKEPGSDDLGSEEPPSLFGGASPAGGAKRKAKGKELTGPALVAQRIVGEWWEGLDVKPVAGFMAVRTRVVEALEAGHSEEAIMAVLPGMTVFSRNSFDLALGQAAQRRPKPAVTEDRQRASGAARL